MKEPFIKHSKSFARRIGKSLSNRKKDILDKYLGLYLFNSTDIPIYKNEFDFISLEIGIGMGDNIINQSNIFKNRLFLGCEPFINGIANVLDISLQNNINNIKLWPDDANLLLENIPELYFDNILIFFPDPWIKTKQRKRRFLNEERFANLFTKIKNDGYLIFASDINSYINEVQNFVKNLNLKIVQKSKDFSKISGYKNTKYHNKAESEGRLSEYMIISK